MSYKKLYIQVKNIDNIKNILAYFNNQKKIDFDTDMEKEIFDKSIRVLEENGFINNFNGFVIGNEFCEHLNSDINKINEMSELLGNKELIINTSILTMYNQVYYKKLLIFLKEKKLQFKIIINDIGFIKLIEDIKIKPENIIIGRLINKQRKIFNIYNKTKNKFDDQSINLNLYNDFFKKYNIDSFALDILPQGNKIDVFKNKFFYFPWGYYTSSRGCVTKTTFSDKNYIFPLKFCDKLCVGNYIKINSHNYLLGKGNSVFYRNIDFINKIEFSKIENLIFQVFFPI